MYHCPVLLVYHIPVLIPRDPDTGHSTSFVQTDCSGRRPGLGLRAAEKEKSRCGRRGFEQILPSES